MYIHIWLFLMTYWYCSDHQYLYLWKQNKAFSGYWDMQYSASRIILGVLNDPRLLSEEMLLSMLNVASKSVWRFISHTIHGEALRMASHGIHAVKCTCPVGYFPQWLIHWCHKHALFTPTTWLGVLAIQLLGLVLWTLLQMALPRGSQAAGDLTMDAISSEEEEAHIFHILNMKCWKQKEPLWSVVGMYWASVGQPGHCKRILRVQEVRDIAVEVAHHEHTYEAMHSVFWVDGEIKEWMNKARLRKPCDNPPWLPPTHAVTAFPPRRRLPAKVDTSLSPLLPT